MDKKTEEMNEMLHSHECYELIKQPNGMIVAEKMSGDNIRLAVAENGEAPTGYVEIIGGKPVAFFKLDEIILIKGSKNEPYTLRKGEDINVENRQGQA